MNTDDKLSAILEKLNIEYGESRKLTVEEMSQKQCDLYNNSVGNLNEYDGYDCDVCKNKGFIARVDEHGYQVHRYCKCKKIRDTLRRIKQSGLSDVLEDYTFNKYKANEPWQKTIKEIAQAFCNDDEAKWFYIGGQRGSGKTHLCTAIAEHYIKSGYDVKYMLWVDESKRLKSLVMDCREYQEQIEQYKNVDVLYIDDFYKVKDGDVPTSADINLAFEILNYRLSSRDKITIISSEWTLGEMLNFDESVMSRINKKVGRYKINIAKDKKKNYRLKDL